MRYMDEILVMQFSVPHPGPFASYIGFGSSRELSSLSVFDLGLNTSGANFWIICFHIIPEFSS